jgi:hypothetical protein
MHRRHWQGAHGVTWPTTRLRGGLPPTGRKLVRRWLLWASANPELPPVNAEPAPASPAARGALAGVGTACPHAATAV